MKQIKGKNNKLIFSSTILLLLFFISPHNIYSQYDFHYNSDYPATITFGPNTQNGFRISASLVATFTTGVKDRNGFRLGAGLSISQTIDNWTFLAGLDMYKAQGKFGMGTSFAGTIFDDGKYGGSYILNKYHQGDKQVSAIVGLHLSDFRLRFEDDILSYPFVGFKIYDRYRTAAIEMEYKGFLIGTNVYTTDINGMTTVSPDNAKGVYRTGKQLSSPIYVGYTSNDLILRLGMNNKTGGLLGQNIWHRWGFDTPDFTSGDYNDFFLQVGVNKPYTLY